MIVSRFWICPSSISKTRKLALRPKCGETDMPSSVGSAILICVFLPFGSLTQLPWPRARRGHDSRVQNVHPLTLHDVPKHFPQPQESKPLGHRQTFLVMRQQGLRSEESRVG